MSSFTKNTHRSKDLTTISLQSHDISHRKKIGAFYTPLEVSNALSKWSIRSVNDQVLEPCFGGCTFLEAAISRLSELGHDSPERNLFGCDIDPMAFHYLEKRINPQKIPGHFFQQDFLDFTPEKIPGGKVDAVIGNPPYIRHSNFPPKQREILKANTRESEFHIHGRANLWAYFVLHTLKFIKTGGRLALVLPGSFLYTDYASSIRELIQNSFKHVGAFALSERLFISEGTEETTVVLLAEGFGENKKPSKFRVSYVDGIEGLKNLIEDWKNQGLGANEAFPGHGLVPAEVGALYEKIKKMPEMKTISDIAELRIGLVTGNTKFFVKNNSDWKTHDISKKYLRYILPRSQYVRGLTLMESDCELHIKNEVRCLALCTPKSPLQKQLLHYLNSYPLAEREDNSTFKRRSIWHQFLEKNKTPDAFFIFMADQGPRIVLNTARVNATNSVYRVFFKKETTTIQMKLATISIYTTLSQLAGEIHGHPRGSGALKLEPSGGMKLTIYMPTNRNKKEINNAFFDIDEKLRQLDFEGARHAADDFLFKGHEIATYLPALRSGLKLIRSRRHS
ncbi:HsdM family class I SAM-dependent methyltransferase [Comamonas odontotermitis]|uniref:HsdM family class I SAM-dependent methyltransferase n=1 Tax=Comamonas odontotermitis TaxID=379895 RepID=UPI001CC3E749|nr:N-6 DNA methylase [Comamonas odontotermitis]UBB18557.1 N-6 DNA methylase [Comamonas odontotermitis]